MGELVGRALVREQHRDIVAGESGMGEVVNDLVGLAFGNGNCVY